MTERGAKPEDAALLEVLKSIGGRDTENLYDHNWQKNHRRSAQSIFAEQELLSGR